MTRVHDGDKANTFDLFYSFADAWDEGAVYEGEGYIRVERV